MAKNQLGQTFVTVQVEKRQFDAAMKQIVRQSVQANTRVNRNLNFRANVGGIGRLNRGLRTSGTLVKGMAGGMAAFSAAVAGATAAIVGLKALQGASGFMRSMVESGFNFNAQMERLSSVFTLLLGNIEASSRMMQQLVKFSQETPLQLPDIARAGVMLLTTKQIAENELLPTLRIIGDAAAASAEGFDAFPRIIRAISQMLAKGKIRAEEMNRQLAEIGIDVWGILAERIGKSKDELIAMAERGELGLKEIQILITGMGEDFKGFGKTASQLFLGLTSTVRDKLAIAMGEVVEPLFEMSTISLLNLKDWMDTPRAAAFVGTLQDGMRGVGDAFRDIDFKDDILPAIESMAGLFKDMAPIFKLMVDSFQVVARLSEGILDTMRQTAQFLGGALQGSQMEFQRSFDAQMRGQGGQGRTVHGRTLSKSREEKLAREGKLAREMRLAGGVTEGTPVSGALANFQQPQSTEQKTAARAFARERESARKSLRTPMEEFREAVTNASRLFSNEPVLYARAVAAARKDFTKEADDLREKFRTPLDIFNKDMAELSMAQRRGIISMEKFAFHAKKIKDRLARDTEKLDKPTKEQDKLNREQEHRVKGAGKLRKQFALEISISQRRKQIAEATQAEIARIDQMTQRIAGKGGGSIAAGFAASARGVSLKRDVTARSEKMDRGLASRRASMMDISPERKAFKDTMSELTEASKGGLSDSDVQTILSQSLADVSKSTKTDKGPVQFSAASDVNRAIQTSLKGGSEEMLTQNEIKEGIKVIAKDFPSLAAQMMKNIPEIMNRLGLGK